MKKEDAKARYDAKNTRQYRLKLNLNTDRDIMDRLADVGNMQGYIKRLIREDLGRAPLEQAVTTKAAEGYTIMCAPSEKLRSVRMMLENLEGREAIIDIRETPDGKVETLDIR